MKYFVIFVLGISGLLVPYSLVAYADNSLGYTEAQLQWDRHNFGITNGTGTAKIVLIDYDSNKIASYAETVHVFVHSDSSPEGITLLLYETEKNSGIFERTFSFSDKRSAPNILYAREGDTATVTYTDNTLPLDHMFSEIHMAETTLIGSLGYPIERLPASNARIVDLNGNQIDSPNIGEQVLLTSDIVSQEDHPQEFIWIAQTIDSQKRVQSLSWINGTINPQSSFSPSTSWIPNVIGDYKTIFFVWESIDNPTALSPPVEIEYSVVKDTSSVSTSSPSGMSQDEREQLQIKKIEHYEIEIIGLKDKYKIGETYSFYFIISGYGYACANYDAKYPDENGNTIGMGVEVLCDAQQRMTEFEINQAERKGTLGNIGIHTSGTYTVTVTFEKPNQYFPTSVSKTFEVVE